ncbi:hypothetical protein Ngar_c15200 [Candidatus Nitrososphaera gargensis Ga9.2]|uniref:Carboxypeptidase regulatory-like domain-containing protein n=1 Tax=Nitrososphaera gargensis (strain Ga9.2) TaxID=1237085 RepID=K0IMY9_NITGG|nr:hypothetical protein [Candidatus Nitrososphaera gargensis]AFU58454.1 hypothetical protein Ngar_c15200 [Candidatus Nitrososphaera gargensis Ga9.2]
MKKFVGGLVLGAGLIIGTTIVFALKESGTTTTTIATTTASSSSSTQQKVTIRGSVGVPFAPINVYKDGKHFATVTADFEGNYEFTSDQPGTYTVKTDSSTQTVTVQSNSKTTIYQNNG